MKTIQNEKVTLSVMVIMMAPTVSKTLGDGNENAQNVRQNAATFLPFTHLAERHYLSINTSIVLVTKFIMTK